MDHEQFLVAVQRLAGVDGAAAERVTRAVLQTLGERISAVQARDLVAQLPAELGPWLFTEDAGQGFDVDEFLRRVAERARSTWPPPNGMPGRCSRRCPRR
jgi:uncharacterized protein (DUF2267 family)